MLREDKRIELVRLSVTLPRMFIGRWGLQTGQKVHAERWKDTQVEAWRAQQRNEPVLLQRDGRRSLWWFRDRFYWDEDGLGSEDVKAIAVQRTTREKRRLKSARSLMRGEQNGLASRPPIPPEVVRAVIEREGCRCVQCGATEDLQFDHIIPVALGGATSAKNLQVLCGTCNRAKSDSL